MSMLDMIYEWVKRHLVRGFSSEEVGLKVPNCSLWHEFDPWE